MPSYGPGVLDILARAYDRALDALPLNDAHDPETARSIILNGILDAARSGERDEQALTNAGLQKIALFDGTIPEPSDDEADLDSPEAKTPVFAEASPD